MTLAGLVFACVLLGGTGEWPEPRQNAQLTAFQPLPGRMTAAPEPVTALDLGRGAPTVTVARLSGGGGVAGLAVTAGTLHAFSPAGETLWACHPPGLNFTTLAASGDLDGDGAEEVLLKAGRPAEPYAAAVLVSVDDGAVRWRHDVEPMSYAWYLHVDDYLPAIPGREVVVLMQGYPPDKQFGYMALFNFQDGALTKRWRYDFDQYTCFPSLLQTDLDGDGARELVVETHSRMWFLDADTGRVKHFARWDVAPANMRSYGLITFTDLNRDGRDDFLCVADFAQHHEVLLNRDGRMEKAWGYGWAESVTTGKVATKAPNPAHADMDGDGRMEVAVAMYNGDGENAWLLRVYDAETGAIERRVPGVVAESLLDIDGDGAAEALVNATDDPARQKTAGARVLRLAGEEPKTIWSDDAATALSDAPGVMRVRREGQIFELAAQGDAVEARPWSAPAPPPCPITAPAVAGAMPPEVLAADLCGDDRNEVLLFQDAKARLFRYEKGTLAPLGEYDSTALPVCADFDGDGKRELALCGVTPAAPPVVRVVAPARDNGELWRAELPPPDRSGLAQPRAAYMRAGRFTGGTTPDLYLWAGAPLVRSVVLRGATGGVVWEKGEVPGSERYWGPSVNLASVWDGDGDGAEDLVFTNPDYYCIASGVTGGFLLGPAFPPDIFKQPSQGLYTFPAVLARDGADPWVCLAGGHYFQAGMTLHASPGWYSIPEPGVNRCASEGFMRLPGGEWLMGFGRQNGAFACVNAADGALRWELPLEAAATDTAAADINGDGAPEFLFGDSHGRLWAVADKEGTPEVVWRVDIGAAPGAPVPADVDGDNATDLVVPCADGRVRVFLSAGAAVDTAAPEK